MKIAAVLAILIAPITRASSVHRVTQDDSVMDTKLEMERGQEDGIARITRLQQGTCDSMSFGYFINDSFKFDCEYTYCNIQMMLEIDEKRNDEVEGKNKYTS